MVISVALLGFGASGTLLALAKSWFMRQIEVILPLLMILCGTSMSAIMLFHSRIFGKFDSYLLFLDFSQAYYLLFIYFVFFIPFFLGGLAIGLVYVRYVKNIGKLYFADLFGSGTGGLVMMGILWLVYPTALPPVISILPLIAGFLVLSGRVLKKIFIPALLFLAAPVYLIIKPQVLPVSQYKSISKAMNLPGAEVTYEKISPHGLVQVVSSNSLRYAPGLSLSFTGNIPVRDVIFNNGNWIGPVTEWSKTDTSHFLDYTTSSLPYVISFPKRALILDAGTGLFAAHAITHGVENLTAVGQDIVTLNLLKNELAKITDSLYHLPQLKISGINSRSYLLSDTSKYDLIILPTVETFGGTSGINALSEQYILTLESFHDMWERLADDGMIVVTSWMDYPVRNPFKLMATLCEAHENKTSSPVKQHLAIIRSWGTISFLLKKSSLNEGEIKRIGSFCEEMFFDPVFLPGSEPFERAKYNNLQDSTFFDLTDMIIEGKRNSLYKDYDFNIRPSTDDRPYFSQFLKPARYFKLKDIFGESSVPFLEIGYLVVIFTFVQISLAALILIILPLLAIRWVGKGKLYTIIHFSGIGLGFMFIEIMLIQQFILYFGNPIYAASAVLSSMLICSGTGSLVSSRIKNIKKNLLMVLFLVILLILLYIFTLTYVLRATIHLPLLLKILFSLLIIFPAAFFMGMPFPLGLRILAVKNEKLLPWAWGINGCLSVISTVLATIIAVEAGFSRVILIAAIAYTLVFGINLKIKLS